MTGFADVVRRLEAEIRAAWNATSVQHPRMGQPGQAAPVTATVYARTFTTALQPTGAVFGARVWLLSGATTTVRLATSAPGGGLRTGEPVTLTAGQAGDVSVDVADLDATTLAVIDLQAQVTSGTGNLLILDAWCA